MMDHSDEEVSKLCEKRCSLQSHLCPELKLKSLEMCPRFFEALLESTAALVLVVDSCGSVRRMSRSCEELGSYGLVEIQGRDVWDVFVAPEQRDGLRAYFVESRLDELPSRYECEWQTCDGTWRVIDWTTALVRDSAGGVDYVLASGIDVTEHRRVVELELVEVNRELQRSNADLERFATVASHDLQEPLRKIQAFGDRLELLYKDQLPERGQDYLARMQNAAGRMRRLIEALLAFSRVATKGQPFETVALEDVVADVVSDLEVRIEHSGGRVEIAELPTLAADPNQMRQLFQNLIGNALKFHREGIPPVVKVSSELVRVVESSAVIEPEVEIYQICVEDNGIGFDERYLDRIFEVFQRLHGRGVYEGTGVGLAICRRIIERHHGQITASSTLGIGSRFLITLPVQSADMTTKQDDQETISDARVHSHHHPHG
jgi:PAS domain S-box-containing protein